jgi:hypothetical protein
MNPHYSTKFKLIFATIFCFLSLGCANSVQQATSPIETPVPPTLTTAPTAVSKTYTTDWVANSDGTDAGHIMNGARSMWLSPEGILYTSSLWDENVGGIGLYQNGKNIGSIGIHNEAQGSAITGNSTDIFTALQFNTTFGSGSVGRYNRATKTRDLVISVSETTTEQRADVVTGLATAGTLLYASDLPGNRVRAFTTDGTSVRDIAVTAPGALALDSAGNIWVAQMLAGTIQQFSPAGLALNTIQMPLGAHPSALYYDATTSQLYVGDQGPDMNIKIYYVAGPMPVLANTFGIQGGYLDSTQAVKGTVGDKRFTRVVGIAKDANDNLYVLNNPWGGTWDLGRNGRTDIHIYDSTGTLQTMMQALNFEAAASPDPSTDGAAFYSGDSIYNGTAGGTFIANTIDPITYPNDPRININDPGRGNQYGQLAVVNGKKILAVGAQNTDIFYLFYFSPTSGYIAIPGSTLPGTDFNTTDRIRGGFCLDANGDIWAGMGSATSITHYPLLSFDSNNKPKWGPAVTTPVPASLGTLVHAIYIPSTDTMVLAAGVVGSTDWTSIGTRIEVYHGWKAGNTTKANLVITPTGPYPKTIDAVGNYLFIGYAATTPDIDAFNLTTGALDNTFVNNPATVYLGNDVDSMYGVRAYISSTGQYIVTKDNYNSTDLIVQRWKP